MAHILFIYKQFPAPSVGHAGGESLFRLMAALQRRGHQLSLVARIRDDEHRHLPAAQDICKHVVTVPHHKSLPGAGPIAMLRSYLALRRAAAQALRAWQPDLVHIETTQTAAVVWGLRRPAASFRTQDVNWFMMEQSATRQQNAHCLSSQLKAAAFQKLEPWLYCQHDLLLAISEGDRQLLAPRCARPILLLPLSPAVHPAPQIKPAVAPGPNLLFVGAMYRDHNLAGVNWFLDAIWPRVLEEAPAARFYIVGSDPPASLRERQDGEHLFVTGFVEDLAPWYRAAEVFVSPLLVGGGLLQKVLDAMAMGVPVVATSGSNHGVGATPGKHILLADTAMTFAEAVVRLLRDPTARKQLGTAGQRFVAEHYDAEAAVDRWDMALKALLGE